MSEAEVAARLPGAIFRGQSSPIAIDGATNVKDVVFGGRSMEVRR